MRAAAAGDTLCIMTPSLTYHDTLRAQHWWRALLLGLGVIFATLAGGCASDPPDWFQGDAMQIYDPFPSAQEPGATRAAAPTADVFVDKVTVISTRQDRISSTLRVRLGLTDQQSQRVERMVRSAEQQQRQLDIAYAKNKAAKTESGWRLYQNLTESIETVIERDQKSALRDYLKEAFDATERYLEARAERLAALREMRRAERERKARQRMGLPADGDVAAPTATPADAPAAMPDQTAPVPAPESPPPGDATEHDEPMPGQPRPAKPER